MAYARIEIKRRTEREVDDRSEEELVPYYSCQAEILEMYGTELYEAIGIGLKNTAVFKVRYCTAIKEIGAHSRDFAVEYDGSIYDLYRVDIGKGDRAFAFLKANCND